VETQQQVNTPAQVKLTRDRTASLLCGCVVVLCCVVALARTFLIAFLMFPIYTNHCCFFLLFFFLLFSLTARVHNLASTEKERKISEKNYKINSRMCVRECVCVCSQLSLSICHVVHSFEMS